MGRLKAKFGRKLWAVEASHSEEASAMRDRVAVLETHVAGVQRAAASTVDKAIAKVSFLQ